jgi:type II secretory pathway component PulF
MATFACRTRNAAGDVVEKIIDAASHREVMIRLEQDGLYPIQITSTNQPLMPLATGFPEANPAREAPPKKRGKKPGKVRRKELMQFSLQLSSSLDAGLPILDGVRSSIPLTRNQTFKQVLHQICSDIEGGCSFSEAMEKHPTVFPEVYIGTVAAGEKSGTLDQMLDNLAEFLEAEMEMRADVRSAIMYPAIVVATLCVAIVVLIVFVVPRFAAFYSGFDSELPLATRMLIGGSSFLENHYGVVLVGLVAVIFCTKRLLRMPKIRARCDEFLLRIPVLGRLIETSITLHVVQLMGLFSQAGVPILEALRTAADTIHNSKYKRDLQSVAAGISVGETLASGMDTVQCFPMEARHMLANGEATGSLERACQAATKRYKKELRYMTKSLATFIEPLLTLVLAVIVLFVALAVFLPMWDLVDVVGK